MTLRTLYFDLMVQHTLIVSHKNNIMYIKQNTNTLFTRGVGKKILKYTTDKNKDSTIYN